MNVNIIAGGLVVLSAFVGAGYAEYARVQKIENNAQAHVFWLTEAYKLDTKSTVKAVASGVKACAAQDYLVEFPPVMTMFLADTIASDYEIVSKYGLGAEYQTDKFYAARRRVSDKYSDLVDQELEVLPAEVSRRVLDMMETFRIDRKKIARCINEKAYALLPKKPTG